MFEPISEKISLFRSQLRNRRFSDGSLQILESVLVSKDVGSLMEIRSAARDLLRSEVTSVLREIAEKSTDQKLSVVDFFVRAFALIGDVESCLALKYEVFVLRDSKYFNDDGLQVSYEEWLQFAKDSLDNGFYTIAAKGFESALASVQSNNNLDTEVDAFIVGDHVVNDIKRLIDMTTLLIGSHSGLCLELLPELAYICLNLESIQVELRPFVPDQLRDTVQAETCKYLKRRAVIEDQKCSSFPPNAEHVASSMFRRGIKRRNVQKLYQSQGFPAGHKHPQF